MNIYEKLISLKERVGGFEKDATGYKYKYVSGSQVLGEINPLLAELGLVIYPQNLKHTHFEKIDGTKDFIVYGDMKYIIVNAEKPEEKIEIDWLYYGQQDEVSKAFGSGLTYAERYFLLKFLGLPTDDEDPDSKTKATPKLEYKPAEKKPEPPKPNTTVKPSDTPLFMIKPEDRSLYLMDLIKGTEVTGVAVRSWIKATSKETAVQLTNEEFEGIVKSIEKQIGKKA